MRVKQAAIRAFRTALQAFVGVLLFLEIGVGGPDLEAIGNTYLVAAIAGAHAGVIAMAQNLAEDNTDLDVPK